ncbi:hypothetical protein CDD82_7886 [Ophiocordyceps australis]|uniref:Uncharacterized protein n=1 Tax=Ophiocordyceps australis TaxID=1399860 RepID=A0A2C5ZPM6_9HYPO|nr:hypothetical protein CDD82_7886 [Ophiocordyceps australis]
MSRITAPVIKLGRALGASQAPMLDSSAHGAGASLMPKYAELLGNRRISEHHDSAQSSRTMTTTHRPTPQPSIASRPKPIMQTFHSSAVSSMQLHQVPSTNLDAALLPSMGRLFTSSRADDAIRVPLLPDNYGAVHDPLDSDVASDAPTITIVAADPDNVLPAAPLSGIEAIGLDSVDLKFAHESSNRHLSQDQQSQGMIRDLWKGMVEDILGPAQKPAV